MGPAIEVQGLTKTYPDGTEAVKGVDFEAMPGEIFGLLGPNGAGKSTTIGMLATTLVPTAGSARLAGHDIVRDPVVDRALSGRRNLQIHGRLWGVESSVLAERTGELARAFGIGHLLDRPASGYSGGERRRLEIARALLSRPEVLFLDEPTVGLDPRVRYELLELIGGLRAHGEMTILLTTHYLDEAERLCDRVAIVHEGRIVALDAPEAALAALRARGVANGDAFTIGSSLTIPLGEATARDAIAAIDGLGLPTEALTTRAPTLDDVYLRLTGSRLQTAA